MNVGAVEWFCQLLGRKVHMCLKGLVKIDVAGADQKSVIVD